MSRSKLVTEEMFSLINQWEQSGMSQKEFILNHQLQAARFYYWLRRYRQADEESVLNDPGYNPGFIEIKPGKGAINGFEVISPKGYRVVFHQNVSVDFLKALIA